MAIIIEKVTEVKHWSDKTFTFKTTRKPGMRFKNGEFVMMGLTHEGKNIIRAYSVAVSYTHLTLPTNREV